MCDYSLQLNNLYTINLEWKALDNWRLDKEMCVDHIMQIGVVHFKSRLVKVEMILQEVAILH